MIGTALKVVNVFYNEEMHIYVAKLLLARDYHASEDNDLTDCTHTRQILKNCFSKGAVNRLNTATIEEINLIFDELDDLFSSERGWLEAVKYDYLAKHYAGHTVKNYNEALSHYKRSLEIYEQFLNDKELNINHDMGEVHYEMASIYENNLDDHPLANEHWNLAITYCLSSLEHAINSNQKLDIYSTLALSYNSKIGINSDEGEKESNTLNAIRYRKMELEEAIAYYSSKHVKVAENLQRLAQLQGSIYLWEEASANYEKAVEIHLVQDKPEFSQIVFIYGDMCRWYTDLKQDYNLALHYKSKELEYRMRHSEANQQVSEIIRNFVMHGIAICHCETAKINIKLRQFKSACEYLSKAKQIYENSTYFEKEKRIESLLKRIRMIELHSSDEEDCFSTSSSGSSDESSGTDADEDSSKTGSDCVSSEPRKVFHYYYDN
ncbi:unnamed protein product [Didymodactylos carnosus]|uniref:Tetratricopeptide repeat protein n=1 Tax=Didymodactylos carnosus TaxID=1234261 RepID=A0A814FXZ2_9BILA|nr:unnamed protein product [Didymodactylos carnosus]CAF3758621.1 unnamed protein product [Didymodactylos carnosus]